jgi:hypothetical protein
MSVTIHDATRDDAPPAALCEACGGEAWFEARVDARTGDEPVSRHAGACAGHLLGIVQGMSAWVRDNDLAAGLLTVLAVNPFGAGGPGPAKAANWGSGGSALCTIAIMRPARTASSVPPLHGQQH